MIFLVIVPIFNEEKHLQICLQSFANQTINTIKYVLVNDSSTDNSQNIAEKFIQDKANFSLINLKNQSEHIPGAKVVKTFYEGLNSQNWKQYDVIVKLDADIILPDFYFEKMEEQLMKNPKIGIVGGLVYIEKNGQWVYENISSKNHVRGPIKTYRKECFEAIGGLRETLGWDNLDGFLARMHNWEVLTLKDVAVKHLKPTAQVYKKSKAEKLGKYFYNIGYDSKLALISCAKAAWNAKSLSQFWISWKSYEKENSENSERKISQNEINFIRSYNWNKILKKFKLAK